MVVVLLMVIQSANEGITISRALIIGCSGFVVMEALRKARHHGDFR